MNAMTRVRARLRAGPLVPCVSFERAGSRLGANMLLQRRDLSPRRGCWGRISCPRQDGHTPLHYAVTTGVLRCVQRLVEFKADVNAPNDVRLSRPRSAVRRTSFAAGATPAMPLWAS